MHIDAYLCVDFDFEIGSKQSGREALLAQRRDRTEKDALIHHQLEQRRSLHNDIRQSRHIQTEQLQALNLERAEYLRRAEQWVTAIKQRQRR